MPGNGKLSNRNRKKLWRGFRRQSLTVKLVLALSLVVSLIIAIGAIVMVRVSKQAIAETSVTTALYRTQLLKTKLIETMVRENPRHEELQTLLENAGVQGQWGEVNIFNPAGEVRFSSVPGNVGKVISVSVDQSDRVTQDNAIVEFDGLKKADRLRIVHPVSGGNQCMTCHQSASGDLIGGIELFVPLGPIYKRFVLNRFFFFFVALGIIGLGAFLIRWLVHRIVKQPIKKLRSVMEKAERGELDVRTTIREDPDLHRLSRSFNSMVQGIQRAQKRIGQQHQKELAQANRLASIGQIISNVSHEIKNPLASISSTLHALRNEFKAVDGQEIFRELTVQTARIEQTVNHLLRYARQAPPRFERCSIANPIHHALHFADHRLREYEIETKVAIDTDDPLVWGDPGQLEQVFLNLLLNAAHAMPKGGVLNVKVFRKSNLFVEMEDTGCGIRGEDLPRIFDPFFTTREGGTGLGLSVVKGIMESHHGTIRAESIYGQGTKVIVSFPSLEVFNEAAIAAPLRGSQ